MQLLDGSVRARVLELILDALRLAPRLRLDPLARPLCGRAPPQPLGVVEGCPTGSKIGVEYSLPPERDDGYRRGPSKVYATVPQGTVATTVAPDWLANELAGRGKVDAACRDRMVMHLMTAAGASAPADAVFRFTAGDAMQTEDDDEDADRSEDYSDDGRASDL